MHMHWYNDRLAKRNWANVLDQTVARLGDKVALIFEDGQRITYKQYHEEANSFAKALLKLGVKKGDRISIWSGNNLKYCVALQAIYKVGAAYTPIYTYYKSLEVEYTLQQAEVSTLIMKDTFMEKLSLLDTLRGLCPEIDQLPNNRFSSEKFPFLSRVIGIDGAKIKGRYDFDELLEMGRDSGLNRELQEVQASVEPFDMMNIMFTSGTTGFPKGGISMHITNMISLVSGVETAGITEDSIVLCNLPLFNNFGFWLTSNSIFFGCTMVLAGEPHFDPARSLKLIEREKVNFVGGSPAMFTMLLEHPDFKKRDLTSLRGGKGVIGGSAVPEQLMRDIQQKLGSTVVTCYGLSECGGLSTTTLPTDPLELQCSTIGIAIPSARVKVVDPETGKRLIGKPGEIMLHDVYPGSCLGKGYYNAPEKTKETITEDGWWKTGDLGIETEDCYFKYLGRAKYDMFTVGGMNVYPTEVENCLMKHPKIAEAVVIGVPDHRLGQVTMAWVRPRAGEKITADEVIGFAKNEISSFKAPRYVRFYQEGELPLTGSGKVQKFKLQEISCQELSLEKK